MNNKIINVHWNANAEYEDGTVIDRDFPYHEDGNYERECERQYSLESWLMDQHENIVWYSVGIVED